MGIFFPTRKIRSTSIPASYTYRIGSGSMQTVSNPINPGSEEILTWSHKKMSDGRFSEGGPFYLSRDRWIEDQTIRSYTNTTGAGYTYFSGPLYIRNPTGWSEGSPVQKRGDAQMISDGATSVARTLPTNPSFDLLTFLGEAHADGIPSVPGIELLRARSDELRKTVGSEYLNVEFGWKPLISDLQDFARTVKNAHSIIDQYRRDSDRPIRRRYAYPEDVQFATGVIRQQVSPIPAGVGGTYYCTREIRTDRWFSGAFKYHVPLGNDPWSKLQRYKGYADKLLGVNLIPEVVWNLTPWSWAVDWFTNAGDVIHNISALGSDGLVMQYGFEMCHTKQSNTYNCFFDKPPSWTTISKSSAQSTHIREFKQRVAANPYGFGFLDSALSNKQLAILAALGLAKSGNMRTSTSSNTA